jgi:hypothetical protein
MSIQVPLLGKQDATNSFKFVKGDKGWMISQ